MAFPPPPVTFPATRLNAEAMSDIAPFGCSFPNGVARFYPNNSDRVLRLVLAKPFGFDPGRK
ncbi:MAG: hypothetical protein M3521_05525 [Acidobacteriota bacterium]|nr:hypothetical protein [Acidobacteriota bacterium]